MVHIDDNSVDDEGICICVTIMVKNKQDVS